MVDPKTYARNVLKSAGYIASETIRGVNPTLTQYVTDNVNYVKDMYHGVRDYKNTVKNKINSILGETGYEDLKTIRNNIMEDLRTGKFFNPEREEQSTNNLMNKMGLSFDFDDMDFDVDESESEKIASETETSSSVNKLAEKIANTKRSDSVTSAKSIIRGGRANTSALIAHNEKMFGQVNSSLANIHSSIINLHKDLATPLNTHIVNSTNFYGIATTELSKQTALLENIQYMIADRFAPIGPSAGKKLNNTNSPWKSIMGYGLPNFNAWGSHVKNKLISDTGMDLLDGLLDPEMLQMLIQTGMSSPIAMALSAFGSHKLAKSSIGKGLDRMIGTLEGGFNHMAIKISKYARQHGADNTLPAMLARLLDIVPNVKPKMDFSNYNKGRQDWTGMDSKALREVIPTQLSQILAAITGKPAKIFDYKSGKFVTSSQIKEDFDKMRTAAIGNSAKSLKKQIINEFIEQDKIANQGTNIPALTSNSKAVRNLSRTYDTLVSMLSIKNVDVSNFKNASELISFCRRQRWVGSDLANGGRDYIFDEKSLRRLAKILYSGTIPGVQGKFEGAIVNGQLTNADIINNAGDTTYGMLYNGSDLDKDNSSIGTTVSDILNVEDRYGNDMFFYLRSYYDQLNILINKSRNDASIGNRTNEARNTNITSSTSTGTRNREPRVFRVSAHVAKRDDGDDSITDEDRYVYNSVTGEYVEPKPTSKTTRVKKEKDSIFSRFFDKINGFLDDLFYGNSDSGIRAKIKNHGGLLGIIKDIPSSIKDISNSINEKLKAFFKEKWDKFRQSDSGKQYFSNMKSTISTFAKDTWKDAKSKASSAIEFINGGKKPSWAAELSGSRDGGVVQKSGMASVSEGEIIIPADQNPEYTGHMGNAARDSVEKTNYKNWLKDGGNEDEFYGFFRKGSNHWTKLTDKDKSTIAKEYNKGKTAEEIAKIVKRPVAQIQGYVKSLNASGGVGMVVDEAKEKINKVKNSKGGKYVEDLVKNAASMIDAGITHLFGDSDLYSNAKAYGAEAVKVAKQNLPKTFADATLGALVGAAVTGSGIGLLGGLVVGAGTSIIKRSDHLSKVLFGTEDINGDYSGGLLPNKVTKFIKSKLPKVGKSAAIGGVLGTLGFAPGGIFGGLAIGAGLELVSSTNTFKDIMFGKPDVYGKRNGGIMGSIRDHVVTPLINFTRGGLVKIGDYIKKNFLNPIANLFNPLKDWAKGKAKKMMSGIVDAAKATVKRTIGERFNALFKPLTERVGAVGKWALNTAGKVVSAPFRLAGKIGEGIGAHNVKAGYSSKSAKERMAMEGNYYGVSGKILKTANSVIGKVASSPFKLIEAVSNKATQNEPTTRVGRAFNKVFTATGKFGSNASNFISNNVASAGKLRNTGYTKWASTASDEDIQAAAHYVTGSNSINRSIIKKRQNLANMITASLANGGNLNPDIVKTIKKLFNTDKVRKDNDFSDIIDVVSKLPEDVMGAETKKLVIDKINECQKSIEDDFSKLKTFGEDKEAFFNRIGLTNEKSRKKFIKEARVQAQLDAEGIRKATGESEAEAIAKAKEKDDADKLLKEQKKESPIDAERNTLLGSIRDILVDLMKKLGVKKYEDENTDGEASDSNSSDSESTSTNGLSEDSNDEEKIPEGTIKIVHDSDGNTIQKVYHNGKWVDKSSDSDNKPKDESGSDNKPKSDNDTVKLLEEQQEDNPIDTERNNILYSIRDLIAGLAKKSGVTDSDVPDSNDGDNSSSPSASVPGSNTPSMEQSGAEANDGGEVPEGTIKTVFNAEGQAIQKIYRNGQWNDNMSDAGTKEAVTNNEEDRKTRNAFYNSWVGGGILNGLKSLFGNKGDGEKKETLWDKIKGFLFGGDSGGGLVSILKSVLPGILGAGLAGVVLNNVGNSAAGTGKDSGMNADTDPEERRKEVESWSGVSGFFKKTALGVDAIENTARGRDTTTYSSDDYVSPYMTERYGSRVIKNAVLDLNPKIASVSSKVASNTVGKIPIVGKALSGGLNITDNATKIATKAKNLGTKVFSGIADSKVAQTKVGQVTIEAVTKIKNVIKNVFDALVAKLGLKSADNALDDVAEEAAEAIAKKGGSKLGSFLAKSAIILQIALIANAVIEGFQDAKAKTILGILDKPTTMQKILAAACNGLNEAIPGIGGIIPTEILFSIMFTALEALGCKFDKLSEQRKEAKATVEQYNKENGTTYNVEEYIHNVLGEYTFQEKIAKSVKSGWNSTVDKFKSFFSGKSDDKYSGDGGKIDSGSSSQLVSMGKVNTNYSRLDTRSASSTASTKSNSGSYSGSGSTITSFDKLSASGAHTTQKGNYRVFGKSTIDQNGCGPAAASTVLKSYGKDVGVNDAASYAEAGGYVAGSSGVEESNGTRASYFNDILGRNGIRTSYTDEKSKIKAAVDSGRPTILLGQDKNNTSKSNSPFGPNPHYVVARGTDNNGNVVVDDPELNGTALYKRDILNKTKLGVATAGDSGISGLITSAFSGFTSKVSEKLGDSTAGKVWNLIFGGNDTSSSDEESTDSASSSTSTSSEYSGTAGTFGTSSDTTSTSSSSTATTSGPGSVSYGTNHLFTVITSTPSSSDPNIKCYNNSSNGGVSRCINGSPTDKICNVLSNCVGWASARFNQIYNLLSGTNNQMKYPISCNAENFIEAAKGMGLSVGTTPQVGAIMVWQKGNTLGEVNDGAGHVAIVERVDSADKVFTSESGWNSNKKMWNQTRIKGTGNWGESGAKFRGFIYNPAVSAKLGTSTSTPTTSNTNQSSTTSSSGSSQSSTSSNGSNKDQKRTIWNYLKKKGFNDYAISGAMGCWQAESGNRADIVEGYYANSYPGNNVVLANRQSLNDYTSNNLFEYYKSKNIGINKSGYLAKDGLYYPGLGLAQWTGDRARTLLDYAEQNGKNFRNLDTQLDYFWKEFEERSGLKDRMNSSTSPQDATTKFLDGFEMYDGWHTTKTGSSQNTKRQGYAQDIYNNYAGTGSGAKPVTYDFTNPDNDPFGTGGNSTNVKRRARNMYGSASKSQVNADQLNHIIEYVKLIAENTTNNKLIGKLVELQNDAVTLLSKVSSVKTDSSSTNASEDYSKSIENDIAKMKAKLDSIAQTL